MRSHRIETSDTSDADAGGAVDDQDGALALQWTTAVSRGREALRSAKAELRRQLRDWDVDERTTNAIVDVVHELVGNALRHAYPPVGVTVTATSDTLRVDVTDGAVTPARVLPYRPGISEHGLGLRIVQQLSQEWGQQVRDDGKSVWATFRRTPPR